MQGISVVAFVAEHSLGLQTVDQLGGSIHVVLLTCPAEKSQRIAQSIRARVDFCA
jgi:hypothetical protein